MRKIPLEVLAGVALIGVAAIAQAKSPVVHQINVAIPGGGVATIRYTGDVAPRISVSNSPVAIDAFAPMPGMFGLDSGFAQLDRISAAMDQRAAAMMQQAEAVMAASRSSMPFNGSFAPVPAGGESYSFVSTMSGNGMCMRSVQITYQGDKPHVISSTRGNCSGNAEKQMNPASNAPPPDRADTTQANAISYAHPRKAEPS